MTTNRKAQRAEALPLVFTNAQVKLIIQTWAESLARDEDRVMTLLLSAAPPWVKLKAASEFKKSVDNFHRFVENHEKDDFRPF